MKSAISTRQKTSGLASQPAETPAQLTERDFTTLDGRLVPRAQGEIALRQHTALLVGGLLIGEWPEQSSH